MRDLAYIEITHRFETLGGQCRFWVVLPEKGELESIPVVTLLHGASDDGSGWLRFTAVERYAFEKNIALVIPSARNGYYADMCYGPRYFSYVTEELPAECRRLFGLSPRREKNYIVGLSMGGYGALKCALTYPERYKACAALSAAVHPENLVKSKEWPLGPAAGVAIFGEGIKNGDIPSSCDLFELAKAALKTGAELPYFYLACGEQDPLYDVNCEMNEFMDKNNIQHTFRHGPGDHNWKYWDGQLQSVLDVIL